MAVIFKVKERKIKFGDKTRIIYTAKPEKLKTTSFDNVIHQIVLQTSLAPGDVLSVLRTLGDVVGYELSEGRAVSLDYLGTIAPSYRSKGVETEEQVTRETLLAPKARFRAKPHLKQWIARTVMELDNPKANSTQCPAQPGGNEGDPTSHPGGN